MEVYKIVFTGGPCAGKTKTIDFVKCELEKEGYYVIDVPEVARDLIASKVIPNDKDREHTLRFQNYVIRMQTEKEKIAEEYADGLKNKDFEFIKDKKAIVILYDRSIMDNRGYLNQEDYNNLLKKYNYEEIKFMDKYDMVIDLISTATTNKELYCLDGERYESYDVASQIDQAISSVWSMHYNIKVIKPMLKIEDKYDVVLGYINDLLESKINRNPLKIQIDKNYTDLSYYNETNSRKIKLTNIYLNKSSLVNYVIKKREYKGCVSYISNLGKENASNMKQISRDEYLEAISTYGVKATNEAEIINVIDKGDYYRIYNDCSNDSWFIEFESNRTISFPKHVKIKTR